MGWRWASASVIGSSHIAHNGRLQDAHSVSILNENYVFAVVSDGAGSAKFGEYGAWIICRSLKVKFRDWFKNNELLPDNETIEFWIDDIRDQVHFIAKERNSTFRQFAATLTALIASSNEILALNIGDSAIVGRHENDWSIICLPENGEYASSTYFFTDDPSPRLKIFRESNRYDAFALFSDGVGDLAILHSKQEACAGFLNPMIYPVDNSYERGRLNLLSVKLKEYLASPIVCEKTDDDKTIILLSEIQL